MNMTIPKEIEYQGFLYTHYKPTVWKPFLECFQKLNWRKKIRFAMAALEGSQMFYMKKDAEVLGYVVLEPSGKRYPDIEKGNWVISPYWIRKDQRRKGYGTILLKTLREKLSPCLDGDIYALVQDSNSGSIRTMEKAGYEFIGYASIIGIFRKYVFSPEKKEYRVYKIFR